MALYVVLLSDIDGDILLLPVGVHHVKYARTWLPTLIYSSAVNSIQTNTFSTSRAIFIAVNVCNGKIHL